MGRIAKHFAMLNKFFPVSQITDIVNEMRV